MHLPTTRQSLSGDCKYRWFHSASCLWRSSHRLTSLLCHLLALRRVSVVSASTHNTPPSYLLTKDFERVTTGTYHFCPSPKRHSSHLGHPAVEREIANISPMELNTHKSNWRRGGSTTMVMFISDSWPWFLENSSPRQFWGARDPHSHKSGLVISVACVWGSPWLVKVNLPTQQLLVGGRELEFPTSSQEVLMPQFCGPHGVVRS